MLFPPSDEGFSRILQGRRSQVDRISQFEGGSRGSALESLPLAMREQEIVEYLAMNPNIIVTLEQRLSRHVPIIPPYEGWQGTLNAPYQQQNVPRRRVRRSADMT